MSCLSVSTATQRVIELKVQLEVISRINSMECIAIEPPLCTPSKNRPANRNWPQNAQIAFQSFSLKMTPDDNYGLCDINIKIDTGEKFGILSLNDDGRVGGGGGEANMIIVALLRLAECDDGLIEIDDVNIENIGLHDLRRIFTVMPSTNVLFSGSVRYNLDPFNEMTDDVIWEALDHAKLKHHISLLPDRLDTCVMSKYFRSQERRKLEIARMLLRKESKVLIIAESHPHDSEPNQIRWGLNWLCAMKLTVWLNFREIENIDWWNKLNSLVQFCSMDESIMQVIYDKFISSTIIKVSSCLSTIMKCDKAAVLDHGRLIELGHPYQLVQNSKGLLRARLEQTSYANMFNLIRLAESNFYQHEKQQQSWRRGNFRVHISIFHQTFLLHSLRAN